MLTTAQRIDLLRIAVDIAKTAHENSDEKARRLDLATLHVFRSLRSEIEKGNALGDASMSDVKNVVDVAESVEHFID